MAVRIADRYTVGPPLGRGGMGTVHEALDERLDRSVAIKLVPFDATTPVERQRFVREARAAARIHHPNAVAVFDAGDADGQLYLVMELLRGRSLAEELVENGRFAVDGAVEVVAAVLAGLEAAHQAGVIHRDIKPGNVMRTTDGTVKVVDFGIARVLDEPGGPVTAAGEFVGTPQYVAPEQVVGEDATARTDVYATGILLFALLTGAPPFERGSPVATAIAHRDDPIPDVRAGRPDVPAALAAVVRRAMAKLPSDRYPTAAAMRRALLATIGATPDPVRTVAPTQILPTASAGPSHRRRRLLPALAVLVALAVGVVVFAVTRADESDDATPTTSAVAPTSVATSTVATTPGAATAPPATAAPATTVAPATDPPVTDAPTTVPPVTEPPLAELPPELADLIPVLAGDPDAFGARTEEILARLGEVVDGRGPPGREARQLRDDVERWRDDGEVSPEAASVLIALLDPMADGGNGNGNGGGDEGDEGDD